MTDKEALEQAVRDAPGIKLRELALRLQATEQFKSWSVDDLTLALGRASWSTSYG